MGWKPPPVAGSCIVAFVALYKQYKKRNPAWPFFVNLGVAIMVILVWMDFEEGGISSEIFIDTCVIVLL